MSSIITTPAVRGSMAGAWRLRLAITAGVAAAAVLTATPSWALVGEGEGEGAAPVVSRSYSVVRPEKLAAAVKADQDYVAGMRAHHAGALTMSQEYLAAPDASSPALKELARAIMHNQRYEIAVLDEVGRRVGQEATVVNLGFARFALQPAASEGLAQQLRYSRYPVPGFLTPIQRADAPVTERDVQFAKAMTIHHQGALDMAAAYQADPNARNSFLGLMNVDIVTDQAQEIALMRRVIAAYPGNPDAVHVPASMIHGMEGMSHGGHGAHGAAPFATPPAGHAGHEPAHHGHGAGQMGQAPHHPTGGASPSADGPRRRQGARHGDHGAGHSGHRRSQGSHGASHAEHGAGGREPGAGRTAHGPRGAGHAGHAGHHGSHGAGHQGHGMATPASGQHRH
ncbi:DUF305 domain-containing protein [Roseomonas sp. SSH11]|uniref:DUF305 domain-containing protein n=2 Tax=Pararoseomonas baculiformis TaxID=2820812 RepID=A0ABS4A9V0_9PROT|nr:DUF305 domain-containing protein [Pararoseomonas baculiformis]